MNDLNSSVTKQVLLSNRQIIDIAIQIALGAVFVIASLRILRPFMGPIVTGGVIAIAIYPLFLRMVERLGGRRKTVVALFALVGLGVITGGLIGLFVGAVILALAYRLLMEWLKDTAEELAPSLAMPEENA